MTRSILTVVLGIVLVGGAGCSSSKTGTPPKDTIPINKEGPTPGGTGKDKNAGPPAGTAK